MWEAGRRRHQALRNGAGERLFNWKICTAFNTSFNLLFLQPGFHLPLPRVWRGHWVAGGSVTRPVPVPTSPHPLSVVGSRQLFNFQAWRLQQAQRGVGRWPWIRPFIALRACADPPRCHQKAAGPMGVLGTLGQVSALLRKLGVGI